MFGFIADKIKQFVVRKATANKLIDIVEVRTKEVGLTSVKTETDIRIHNSFFLSITILSIQTELLNRDGLKVGRMRYEQPYKIKGKSDAILTTTSEVSIITSIFQAISTILSQPIKMQSVGAAQIKFLWWTFEIPVNDAFEIHPSKLKIVKEETLEERAVRLEKEAQRRAQRALEKEAWREEQLRRKYKDQYIPKEQRHKAATEETSVVETTEEPVVADTMDIVLDEQFVAEIAAQETKEEEISPENSTGTEPEE